MKITSNQAPAEFQPVTITLTLTTEQELRNAYEEFSFVSAMPQHTVINQALYEVMLDYI